VPASVYWKDKDGNYLGHSAYAVQRLHNTQIAPFATKKNIVGRTDYDIFTKEIADKYRTNDLYVIENKAEVILEENIVTPKGEELLQLSSKKPLYDNKGNIIGVIGTTIDITEHKKVEQLKRETELQKIQLQEQENFRAVANQVSHDIRSPLACIQIITELLKEISEPERISLKEAATRINDIANNLLKYYRKEKFEAQIEEEKLFHVLVSLSLSEIISEKRYQYQNLSLEINYSNEPNTNFIFVKVNLSDFNRMISNLINNAVEAVEGKKGIIDISLK